MGKRDFKYDELMKAARKKMRVSPFNKVQEFAGTIWKRIKSIKDDSEFEKAFNLEMRKLAETSEKGTVKSFFAPAGKSKQTSESPSTATSSSAQPPSATQPEILEVINLEETSSDHAISLDELSEQDCDEAARGSGNSSLVIPERECPSEKANVDRLQVINNELDVLEDIFSRGRGTPTNNENYNKLKQEKSAIQIKLKRLRRDRVTQKERRGKQKQVIEGNPDIGKALKISTRVGRPSVVESSQPDLIKHIVDIVEHNSMAHERRHNDTLKTVTTLDDLKSALLVKGIDIARSTLYYYIQPPSFKSIDGRKHVLTAPVRLLRAQNDKRKDHIDRYFAKATIDNMKEMASMMGRRAVGCISQDDKARVDLGRTAAKVQKPILMHLDYKVQMSDHDFVAGPGLKLIPSVYSGLMIKENGFGVKEAVTYSGKFEINSIFQFSFQLSFSHRSDFSHDQVRQALQIDRIQSCKRFRYLAQHTGV